MDNVIGFDLEGREFIFRFGEVEAAPESPWIMADGKVRSNIQQEVSRLDEVVRCRDCSYAVPGGSPSGSIDCRLFSVWDDSRDEPRLWGVEDDGFCKWGERRDGAR